MNFLWFYLSNLIQQDTTVCICKNYIKQKEHESEQENCMCTVNLSVCVCVCVYLGKV